MSDTKLIQAVLDRVANLDRKVDAGFKAVNTRIEKTEKRLTKRIDKLGSHLAYLEDDAPTREEFDELTERVDKVEKLQISSS